MGGEILPNHHYSRYKMATIPRDELLTDIKLYIRSDNVFSDTQVMIFAEKVITAIGDNDDNYEEVLCKSLKSIAINNKAQKSSNGPTKVIKTEGLWEEFFEGDYSNTWEEYLEMLDDICVSFGYTGLSQYSTGYMYISPGNTDSIIDAPPVDINPLPSTSTSGLYL